MEQHSLLTHMLENFQAVPLDLIIMEWYTDIHFSSIISKIFLVLILLIFQIIVNYRLLL